MNNCFKCHAELSKVLFSLRINNLITYTFVIILTRIGERLDPDCQNISHNACWQYLSKQEANLGFWKSSNMPEKESEKCSFQVT